MDSIRFDLIRFDLIRLNWIGLDSVELDWIRLVWFGLLFLGGLFFLGGESRKSLSRIVGLLGRSSVFSLQDFLHLGLLFLKYLLEVVGNIGIGESNGKDGLHQFSPGKVKGGPDPRSVRSGVGLQGDAGVEGVVNNDLHGLFLSHQDAHALVFLVLEDANVSDSALLPRLFARANVQHGLAVDEELSSLRVNDILFFFSRDNLDLLQFDHGGELGGALFGGLFHSGGGCGLIFFFRHGCSVDQILMVR
mmetsp:Transcript_10814/g.31479  ORF Transcript_10814/g.31479 Transcript_10814/m.31479 type:complete len:248 (-) Transcript_10814:89-832(-)